MLYPWGCIASPREVPVDSPKEWHQHVVPTVGEYNFQFRDAVKDSLQNEAHQMVMERKRTEHAELCKIADAHEARESFRHNRAWQAVPRRRLPYRFVTFL